MCNIFRRFETLQIFLSRTRKRVVDERCVDAARWRMRRGLSVDQVALEITYHNSSTIFDSLLQ